MGRPKLPKGQHTVQVALRLRPGAAKKLAQLANNGEYSQAQIVSHLVEEAPDTYTVCKKD